MSVGRPALTLGFRSRKHLEIRVAAAVEWLHQVHRMPLRDKGGPRIGAYRYVAGQYLAEKVSPQWVHDVYKKRRAQARAWDFPTLHRLVRPWIDADPIGPRPVVPRQLRDVLLNPPRINRKHRRYRQNRKLIEAQRAALAAR